MTDGPWINAEPNPVPWSAEPGQTTITWSAGDGGDATIYVGTPEGEFATFALGSEGTSEANWIQPGVDYYFMLRPEGSEDITAAIQVVMAPAPVPEIDPPTPAEALAPSEPLPP
ncbi:MAG: hypothetical protein ACR2J8_00945, partial [Thermomicrobiales bacterium]